jgi:hypothetical protein
MYFLGSGSASRGQRKRIVEEPLTATYVLQRVPNTYRHRGQVNFRLIALIHSQIAE